MKTTRHLFSFLLFLVTSLMTSAQTKYDPAWAKVHDLMLKKNLPKSALTEVRKIYAEAKREGAGGQMIKALIYTVGLQSETREDNQTISIRELEAEVAAAKEPARSILQSITAREYWDYYKEQQWKIYNR